METQHKSDLFPFKCTPYMPVARDVIHRAVIEMALPKKKDIGIDERRSGWVQGITDVSTDNTERETIWFYRTYGNIRKWKRRTVEEVRFFFMKRTNTNELLCLPTSDIQRALEKLDWEVVRGLLLWCAAIYHGRWTAWEYPSWFLYKIWNLRIEKEKSFTFIHTLFKHLYVQIGDELYPCWDINEQTVLNNGSCKNIFGTWTQHMQERVHVSQRIGYGLIPWFVMRVWGREEFIGRMGLYVSMNDHPGGKYRVNRLLQGVLGHTEYQHIFIDAGRWRRTLGLMEKTENIMKRYGWEIINGVGALVKVHGYSQRIAGALVTYKKINQTRLQAEYNQDQNLWYEKPFNRIK